MDSDDVGSDPLAALAAWLDEARGAAPQPDAMALATATQDGRPSVRIVLLRGLDERGVVFFTNRASRKADELGENPQAAICIHWWELGRQVRVEGAVGELGAAESEAYWRTRPRGSQLAAWASPQSRPLGSRGELEAAVASAAERFAGGAVPLPPFWGGYRLVAETVELWTHRDDRLHDRIRFRRDGGGWAVERLAP